MHTFPRLAAATLAFALWASPAHATSLEELYERPAMDDFFAEARPAAERGDTDALFLIGKAYHVGKGTEKDLQLAVEYYGRARAQGSARAAHNLGLIALDDGRRNTAIGLFNEALAKGLQLPTLRNLGRAYAPPHPTHRLGVRRYVEEAGQSGDAYAEAYRITSSVNDAFDASSQYYRAWFFTRNAAEQEREGFDHPALRERAMHWLQIGMDKDLGPAWTNFGVLLMEEGNFDEARPALERGAAKNVPVAHYHLANMTKDEDAALAHMERAALLGLDSAHHPAQKMLFERFEHETDLDVLARAAERMAALREKSTEPYMYRTLQERLDWGRHVAGVAATAGTLPQRPVRLHACGLDLGQTYGDAFNVGRNTDWRLVVYKRFDEPEPTGIEGRVDGHGCATTADLPSDVVAALRDGAVPGLHFANWTLPLTPTVAPRRVTLDLMPLDAPRPPN